MMLFLGNIGTLMKGSEQLISSAFGGIASILFDKFWTISQSVYCFVVEALMHYIIWDVI